MNDVQFSMVHRSGFRAAHAVPENGTPEAASTQTEQQAADVIHFPPMENGVAF